MPSVLLSRPPTTPSRLDSSKEGSTSAVHAIGTAGQSSHQLEARLDVAQASVTAAVYDFGARGLSRSGVGCARRSRVQPEAVA